VISVRLAQRLRDGGLVWRPRPGDRFAVPDRDLAGQVFVVSDMTVEVRGVPGGQIVAFHGTTEWALDDLDLDEALWLPEEHRLRELLGDGFRRLERVDGGYGVVVAAPDGRERAHTAADAADAYALALLPVLAG